MHDKYFQRNVINKLQARCNEKENGCQWEGLLGEMQHHLAQCQYVKEDCPYQCEGRVQRRHLEEHKANLCPQRSFDCGHCDYRGTYREVTDQHWSVCVSFPLACPNNCGADNIPQGQLQAHIECPLQEVACDFSHAGCKVQVVRQDLSQHMSNAAQQHMALVSRALLQDKEREIAQLKQPLREKDQHHKEEVTKKDREHKEETVKIVEECKEAVEKKDRLDKEERENNDEQHRQQLTKKDREHKEAMEKKDRLHKGEREKKDEQHRQELAKKDREHQEEMAKKTEEHKEEMEMKDKRHKEVVERMSRLEGKGHTHHNV